MCIVQHPNSFARFVRSFKKVDTLTRPNYFCALEWSKECQERISENYLRVLVLRLNRLLVLLIVVILANYIDIACSSRQNVLDFYEKLSIEKWISNLRLLESDKITVTVYWVTISFAIDTPKQYLETRSGSVLRNVTKVDKMGAHHFGMRKDDLKENRIGSYIYINGQQFLIRYKGQIESCHICNKPGHKGVDCDEKIGKQWPKLSDVYQSPKLERMLKFPRNSRSCRKKTKKMKLCSALLRQTL